jgi:hypothetical protein
VTLERNLCYIQAATLCQKINSRFGLDPVDRTDIWQRCSFTPPYGFFGASSCSMHMAVLVCIVRLLGRSFFYRGTKARSDSNVYALYVVQSYHRVDRFSYKGG